MFVVSVLQAASSLAPSDKYHKNPQGGHRQLTSSSASGGGGETSNRSSSAVNNNTQFSHNGLTTPSLQQGQHQHHQHEEEHQPLLNQSSPYHFYPGSVGSSSITSSSHQFQQQQQHHHHHHHPLHHQPPYLYKSNHSSGSGGSGNGSHIIIDGSASNGGSVEGSNNKYYYYNNSYYQHPIDVQEEGEDPDQIFTITAQTTALERNTASTSKKGITMGRVGEDVYPPGSPASIGSGTVGGSGLFKSKSGSIPVSNPQTRGFRDTFISSMSPPAHAHSAESSPLHRSASATTANRDSDRFSSSNNNIKQEPNKKWTFGGLFRRNKSKAGGASVTSNNSNSGIENGAVGGGAPSTNNSNSNSPAKVNNNYGGLASGSPVVVPQNYSPAPSSSLGGFVNVDPSAGGGHSETLANNPSKFVNAEVQTRAKGKLSESDISTCDSDFELSHHHENPPEPAPQDNKGYKQNFLVRRLSRRREKAAAKKAAAATAASSSATGTPAHVSKQDNNSSTNGFNSSQHGYLDVPQMKRRVGSSPDSLNNSSEPWPSWETTKKPQTQLQVLQQQQRLNYSSNGSLSLSQDGSNNNNNQGSNGSRSSRAAVKDAVKARAIARRESFLRDSSSSDDDDTEERSRSSLQGSFSSLNSRNRRQKAFNMQQVQFQQQRHLFPATTGGVSCASPSSPMPVPLDYRNSMSPNMNRRLMMMGAPGSPKWEARVIYQQENITENNQPVVFRLPRKERSSTAAATTTAFSNPSQMSQTNGDQSYIMATEMISEDQHVVTAGLKVPFIPVQNQSQQQHQLQDQQCFRNGQLMYPDDPVQYANVANGMRGRSTTPYTFNNTNGGIIPGAIHHHASATPPPPPPPRRDFSRATNNPNFYRPMSCSYLDSYAASQHHHQQLNEQQLMRQQSPMLFNGNYIYPHPQHHQYQGQEMGMNGFATHSTTTTTQAQLHNSMEQAQGAVRSSPRHLAGSGSRNAQDVVDSRHPPLIRSPSEPPAIRVEQAHRNSPVKRLVSSPMPNGNNNEGKMEISSSNNPSPSGGKNPITSKLGFPVRRLQEASKLTGPQSPVHLRASEFWRKKESEVTGSSPVGANNQKKYLNRIRSADSSPLPVPKMRKSPGVVASNESISSLSSFSENGASPGPPKNSSSPINPGKQQNERGNNPSTAVKVHPIRAQISKTPNPQQLAYGNNNKDKENNNTQQQQSAVERLKVRIPSAPDGIKSGHNPNGPSSAFTNIGDASNKAGSGNNPIRALIELNNGKTPGKNLEDALNELEDMYKSLRLSDEDLLDRAERRDLPTPHQELRNAPLIPIPQAYRFEHLGSVESLGTGSGSSGTNYTAHSAENICGGAHRVRAPPVRRSSRPDTVTDDMANRRLAFPDGKPLDPRLVVAKTGSYLARSPAFSPCTSPCPQDGYSLAFLGQEEPDLTLDDVTFRNYKRANSIRLIDPQPPFGIPLGPITAAAATDYLHSKPTESYRPIFGHLKTPDIVNDDIAFRNLRKDLGGEGSLNGTKDWTPRLFSPNRETAFNYPKVKDNKKLRAIRSLSANITHMIPGGNESGNTPARDSPTSCFQHGREIGNKWNSFSDLHRRASAGSPARASTYLQPSWVEQIEKVQTSTETLTDHRNSSSRLSTAILDPPEHWERKFPKKTVELTPPTYDPNKPRRPWTDIILESFEKEEQKELEEAEANEAADANNKTGAKSELLEAAEEDEDVDDDVFMDASEEASKSGALQIHGSKNNDPLSRQQQTRPNMESSSTSSAVPILARPLPLLPGQKTRRGSWVEPSYTSRSFSSSTAFQASHSSPTEPSSHGDEILQDKRRKSWSDLPKDIDSYSSAPITLASMSSSSGSGSPTRKLFNPLPPPKKIRQINLEAFNNNSSVGNPGEVKNDSSSVKQRAENAHDDDGNSQMTSSSSDMVKSSSTNKIKGEDELNELMDQLLKDADTCGQSIRDEKKNASSAKKEEDGLDLGELKTAVEAPSNFSAVSSSSSPPTTTRDKSISETENSQKGEMEMDGRTSSSEKSCKQDLSCTIVGMIPKHQSPTSADRNNRNAQPNFSQQQQQASNISPLKSSPLPPLEIDSSSGSAKVLKTDNNGKGNVIDGSNTPVKDLNTGKSASLSSNLERSSERKKVGAGAASSIEDLIESINESLPELEASCGVGIRVTHSDGKPNGSSSSSGSPASSIPSPSPGSPTPPVLSVSVKESGSPESGPLSPSVFPVPAKRHHLPTKVAEESLYENLPVRMITGNDEKVSSSPSSTGPNHRKQGGEEDPRRFSKTGKVPPLTHTLHDSNNDEEDDDDDGVGGNEDEEPAQHSSSHQPSSLSSNDSSEVSGSSPREDRATNNISDNNKDKVGQTSSSSSIPLDKNTFSSSSFDAFPKNSSDDKNASSSNVNRNRSSSSSGEMLMRKKSEGSVHGLSSERDDYKRTGEPSLIMIVDPSLAHLTKRPGESLLSTKENELIVNPERETYITSSTSSSSSSVEDANQKTKKKEQQPVAGVSTTFPCVTTSTSTTADKKCSVPSLATSAAVETSASETTSAGMSFLRNNFSFFRNSTSRSRSQSVVSDVSRSSETGDSKREKDKSYRRKSHLNRAFTDEPVPDHNYSLDHTPKSSKPTSQDPSSMENSAMEESRTKPAVKLHPVIPPVLTGKSGSPNSKPLSRNGSNKNFESTPSPVPFNSALGKAQTTEQNRKSTPVVKKDSFSDAEGVCFIKKMLQKESDRDRAAAAAAGTGNKLNSHTSTTGNGSSGGYNIKKSPSVGNQSYWSKFSSSQPAFLRKLFEKPKISESPLTLKATQKNNGGSNGNDNSTQSGESNEKDSEKENAEPAMGFSVAQKASFFMKLEHEQRFSRWRKNSVDFGNTSEQTQLNGSVNSGGVTNLRETRPRSRYLTQPVTPTEVKELAPLVNLSSIKLESQDRNLEFGSQPRIWGNSYTSLGTFVSDSSEKMSNDVDEPSHIPKSSYKDCDDPHKFEPIILGSLKERVNKFDEIVTRKLEPMGCSAAPTPTVKSYSLTRSSRNNHNINDTNNLGGGFPMYHSASAIINTPAKPTAAKPTANFYKYAAAAYSSSSSSFSEAVSRNDSTKFLPAVANKAHCKESYQPPVEGNKRRSSVSELELSATTAHRSPIVSRSEKVRSMFISGGGSHYDAETLSEDGEVSSGGQEVAEIICRSYENSPVFRKKTWRAQKQPVQSNFTKEIWRRCGNYENWNNRSYTNPPQQPQHPVPQTFTATTNVTTAAPPSIPPVSASPPMRSNLLQILTVLSSSNDELSESKPKSKKRQGSKQVSQGSGSDSIPPVHPGHQNYSGPIEPNSNNTAIQPNPAMAPVPAASEIFVSVPHPEDEAFQSFFCSVKSYTKVTQYPPGVMQNSSHLESNGHVQQRFETLNTTVNGGASSQSTIGIATPSSSNEGLDISSVRREGDLLVMKKNVPTAKRKSSGKYKNPLRALAARMDFRQQGYTQINNNAVQCSSDVDVTT